VRSPGRPPPCALPFFVRGDSRARAGSTLDGAMRSRAGLSRDVRRHCGEQNQDGRRRTRECRPAKERDDPECDPDHRQHDGEVHDLRMQRSHSSSHENLGRKAVERKGASESEIQSKSDGWAEPADGVTRGPRVGNDLHTSAFKSVVCSNAGKFPTAVLCSDSGR
jgi:hypothetical protein